MIPLPYFWKVSKVYVRNPHKKCYYIYNLFFRSCEEISGNSTAREEDRQLLLVTNLAPHLDINLEMICHHTSLLWFAPWTEVMSRVENVWVIYVMPKNNGWGAVLRIRDPGLFETWNRDSRWVKNQIRIRDEQPGSYFGEIRNNSLG